ncbi:MAG: BRO-N domain-containing protein [Acidithiobacillus sp.]
MDTHTPGASAPLQAAKPAVFQFHSTKVRTIDRDGQVWFVAGDIAKVLNYADAVHLTRVLDEDEAALHNVETRSENGTLQTREVTILSESGLYHALLKSRKREAKPFRKWVTAEVLPAIRRSGGYAVPQDHTPSHVPSGTKLLLTFEANGCYRAEPVPEGAMVVTARQIAEIVETNGYILAKPVGKEFKPCPTQGDTSPQAQGPERESA